MDVSEIVDNEPAARPFLCDWEGCGKGFNRKSDLQRHYRIHTNERPYSCDWEGCNKSFIQRSALTVHVRTHTGEKPHECGHEGCFKRFSDSSSLARHRRIHTGKRPYRCHHERCSKTFCRKTTMVKHFKRTHPGRAHAADMDIEAMSDSVSGGTPATPENNAAIPWRGNNEMPMVGHPSHQLHRAASFAEFGQPISNYGLQPQYNHRHSLSSSGAAEFHHGADPLNQPTLHPQQQQQQQQHQQQHHPGVPVLQRTASVPHHSYFVSDQNNPGVATMNATPHHPPQHVPYQHQVPRQGVEPLPLEIPSYPSAGALSGSIPNNSPGSFSAASGRSPSTQEGFYTHAPPGQTAGYTLHAPSPVDPQTPQMVNYHQAQLPPSQAAAAAAAAAAAQVAMTRAAPGQPLQQQQQQQQQQQPAHAQPGAPGQEQPWYAGVEYQPPVEVVTIGSVPPFSAGSTYDPWASVKLGFDDPSLQMPSERIASM